EVTNDGAVPHELLLVGVLPVGAWQEGTPEVSGSILAGMEYAQLAIQIEDGKIVLPEQVPAGRTLITYTNEGRESSHPFLLRVPEIVGVEQALADLGPEAMEPPGWFFEATFPGFVGETLPGETSRAVVDLAPGSYLVLDDAAFPFEVVEPAETPAGAQDPESDGTVRLFEMGFGLPEAIEPGRQVLEVTNDGAVPHELLLVWSPKPVTPEQAVALFESEDPDATPEGGGPSGAEIVPAGGMGWLSPGMTAWAEVDLETGYYIAVCFVFDPETGMPHAMQGMVDVFTVVGGGTPATATPEG
ncbi:MAG: hypothetical protein H0U10_10945, partial [Chloroflexia bacterium]|nr:hypothetical protein [Chloroflexia bacterium]